MIDLITFLPFLVTLRCKIDAATIKLVAARTRFVASYVAASTPTIMDDMAEEETVFLELLSEGRFERSLPISSCISALMSLINSALFDHCLSLVMRYTHSFDDSIFFSQSCNECEEASASALIRATFMFAAALVKCDDCEDKSFMIELRQIVLEYLRKGGNHIRESSKRLINRNTSPPVRLAWLNSAHSAVLQFLQTSYNFINDDELTPASRAWMKPMCFILLSRLQPGEETLAARIFRYDSLSLIPVSIRSILFRELCTKSPRARKQYLHSILSRGDLLDGEGTRGPFQVESLRCVADCSPQDRGEDPSPLLPMGKLCLLHILSSTINIDDIRNYDELAQRTNEAKMVILDALDTLLEMENEDQTFVTYASQIEDGTKLYHLMNVCLFGENLIRDNGIQRYVILFMIDVVVVYTRSVQHRLSWYFL